MNFSYRKAVAKGTVSLAVALLAIFTIANQIEAQTNPVPETSNPTTTNTETTTETKTDAPESKDSEIGLIKLFNTGGWSMWPLLLSSIVALGVIFERLYFFLTAKLVRKGYNQDLQDAIDANGLAGAENFIKENDGQRISFVLKNGMEVSQNDPEIFASGVEREASEVITLLEKGLTVLAAVSTIAPLVGFLGTVSGMINAFDAIANADQVNAKVVAGGIKEALITTAAGLIVAIPAMTFYQYLQGRVAFFTSEVEEAANKIYKEYLKKKASGKVS
ncbi:MAG: MotA/TolQ/ExbB proton channel family protein [Leptospira sp.]|nr:MotA/TolQ/ExbB proton channel family protein [Leptospira sp.]